jgi:DNA-binding LytR/AlgR family response regulator
MPDLLALISFKPLKTPKVILVTSDKNFAMEAFEYECSRLSSKPITEDRFQKIKKAKAFKINANSKQTTAVGEDNKMNFMLI